MALDFLFGAKPAPTVTTTATQGLPLWYEQYLQSIAAKGSKAAGEGYQTYGGQRVAGLTQDQQTAYSNLRSGIGQYQPLIQTAGQYATNAGSGFNQSEFDQYMNPYMEGVTNQIAKLGARNLSENILPGVGDTFIRSGQYGSGRMGEMGDRAIRDTQEAILGEQARSLASGFNTALGGYQAGRAQQIDAAQGLGSLATTGTQNLISGNAALEASGQAQQSQQQRNLDLAYGDFTAQRDYDRQQTEYLSNLLRGNQTGGTTTTTGPANQSQLAPSALGQIAGAGLGIYGLYNSLQRKKGGRVRRKKAAPVKAAKAGIGQFAEAA
jgi:hypothetical protein